MRISTTVTIAAPRTRVWELLAGFDDYDRWNPLCKAMRGRCAEGEIVRFQLDVGGRRLPVTAEITTVIPERELRWVGPSSRWARRLASGEHFFVLHDEGTGTRVEHDEVFRGALGVSWQRGERLLTPSYEALNRALAAEAESKTTRRSAS